METELLEKLIEIFPDKEYQTLSEIQEKYPYVYENIKFLSAKNHMKNGKYMEALGFIRVGIKTNNIADSFDAYTLKKLYDLYNLNVYLLAQLLHCTPQNIYRQIRKKKPSNRNKGGWIAKLTGEEIQEVLKVIEEGKFIKITEQMSIMILSNTAAYEEKAIIVINDNKIKCCFDVDEKIKKALSDKNLDIFSEQDFDVIEELENEWKSQGSEIDKFKKIIRADIHLKNRVKTVSEKKRMSVSEYLDILDYKFVDSRHKKTDEEIISIIKKYVVHDNTVRIKVKEQDYQFLARTGSRNGYGGIEGLVNHYGFIFEKGKDSDKVIENYKKIIQERYIVKDNIVYFSSMDPFYKKITGLANTRNISRDELLKDWGFERVSDRKKLPIEYVPYDYSNELKDQLEDNWSRSEIDKILSKMSNDKNEVYIDITTYFYYILFLQSKIYNKSIDNFLLDLGYIRVYRKIEGVQDENTDEIGKLEQDKKIFIERKLQELQDIEILYKEKENVSKKPERNQKLVKTLKDLYQCKCQLCGEENTNVPIIEEKNGQLYCEVHHIREFNLVYNGKDDIEEIDNYKNAIVLCPFHHAFVHFHHGGYSKICGDGDEKYLENDYGKKIKIITNYHL